MSIFPISGCCDLSPIQNECKSGRCSRVTRGRESLCRLCPAQVMQSRFNAFLWALKQSTGSTISICLPLEVIYFHRFVFTQSSPLQNWKHFKKEKKKNGLFFVFDLFFVFFLFFGLFSFSCLLAIMIRRTVGCKLI